MINGYQKIFVSNRSRSRWMEEWIAECTYLIESFRISYQGLINDLHQSEVTSKAAKDIIVNARVVINKAQVLIQDHELKLANEKKKMEELEATKHRVLMELDDHSAKLETLLAQLSSKILLYDEKLRPRPWLRLRRGTKVISSTSGNKYNLSPSENDFLFLYFFLLFLTLHLFG